MSQRTADLPPIQPLFAYNERLWIRIWALAQGIALLISAYLILERTSSLGDSFAGASAIRTSVAFVLLVGYHVVGIRWHRWILHRRWAVVIYLPLGWLLILASLSANGAFGLLVLGAIIQGFIFLPFAWAIGILATLVMAMMTSIILHEHRLTANVVSRLGGVLATGTMIATVMAYINHVNRDAMVRGRLLQQLDDAQRDLAERAREAGVREERQRLARDIHDTLAQGFSSVIRHLEAVELSVASGATEGAGMMTHVKHAQDVSRSSLTEIRRLVFALQPQELTESTLGAAIERIVSQWSEANGVAATVSINALPPFIPDADVIFLRATQEALSNVARHARASQVSVSLGCTDGLAMLTIDDDGAGFAEPEEVAEDSFGLRGMRERARKLGGQVLIDSAVGEGTSVTIALPLALTAQAAS